MKHSANIVLSRAYWSESYDQASRYGSRLRSVELSVGVLFVVIGFGYLFFGQGELLLPWVLVVVGVFEILFSNRVRKFFWLRRQLKSKLTDQEVALTFDDDGIETSSPSSTGRATWSGIEKVVRTPRGILVWPQKGIFFFVPEAVVGKDGVDFIASRVN